MLQSVKDFFRVNEAEEAASDDNPLAPTRPEHKQNTGPMLALAFGWGFLITGLLTGGNLAAGVVFWPDLIEAAFWGNLVNFVVGAAVGYMGYKTACNSGLLYRFAYGRIGVYLPVIFLALLTTGWQGIVVGAFGFAWVQGIVVGIFGQAQYAGAAGFDSPWFYAFALMAGALYTITTYYGVKGIQKISVPSVAILVVVGFYAAYLSIDQAGGWDAFMAKSTEQVAKAPISMLTAINIVIGSWIVGAVVMPEYTRFAKSAWVAIAIPFIVLIISQFFLQIIGSLGATASGSADFTEYMSIANQGLVVGGLGLIGMSLALWTTGDANLYLPVIQTASTFRLRTKAMVLFWGTLGTIFGLGIYQNFFDWINTLANIVPPLVGPLIVDYYLVHRANYRTEDLNRLQVWNPASVAAYVIGAVSTFYTPAWAVAGLFGLVVSMIAYAVLYYAAAAIGVKVGYAQVQAKT
ncbi:MAG: cytosine permease [Rhodospirillaceae bacterium]|nr:cytosine permease [Rhodospirillaceae bacterium]